MAELPIEGLIRDGTENTFLDVFVSRAGLEIWVDGPEGSGEKIWKVLSLTDLRRIVSIVENAHSGVGL